jgi:BNR/Asp-box repeat
MQTFDTDATSETRATAADRLSIRKLWHRPDRGSRRGILGGLLLVVLLGGVTAAIFTQLAGHRGSSLQSTPTNTWVKVLTGYTISAVENSPSQPNLLYACATRGGNSGGSIGIEPGGTYTNPPFTILRSADGGDNWTDIGAKAGLAGFCQLAVNPAQPGEVYVVSAPKTVPGSAPDQPSFLMYTTNGGQTWSRIDPAAIPRAGQAPLPWSIQDLRVVDGRLFGLIAARQVVLPPSSEQPAPEPASAPSLERLAMSQDGGRTWNLLDSQFQPARLETRGYAVDPSNPNTVYVLVGQPVGPVMYMSPHSPPLPAYPPQPAGVSGDLYKTTDGGGTWMRILANLPFGMNVQLGGSGSSLIYVGGSPSPIPLIASTGVSAVPSQAPQGSSAASGPPSTANGFNLRVSRDGGATWQHVPLLPAQIYVDHWLVAPDGSVYVYEGGVYSSPGSATAVPGSSGSGGGSSGGNPGQVPPEATGIAATPASAAIQPGGSPTGMTAPTLTPPPLTTNVAVRSPMMGKNLGFRYNPATAKWSQLAMPPVEGTLLAVTATVSDDSGTALWFVDLSDSGGTLYRDLV